MAAVNNPAVLEGNWGEERTGLPPSPGGMPDLGRVHLPTTMAAHAAPRAPRAPNRFLLLPLSAADRTIELALGEKVPIGRRSSPVALNSLHISREQVVFQMLEDAVDGRILIKMDNVRASAGAPRARRCPPPLPTRLRPRPCPSAVRLPLTSRLHASAPLCRSGRTARASSA